MKFDYYKIYRQSLVNVYIDMPEDGSENDAMDFYLTAILIMAIEANY